MLINVIKVELWIWRCEHMWAKHINLWFIVYNPAFVPYPVSCGWIENSHGGGPYPQQRLRCHFNLKQRGLTLSSPIYTPYSFTRNTHQYCVQCAKLRQWSTVVVRNLLLQYITEIYRVVPATTMSLQSVRGLVFLLSFVAYLAAITNAATHNYNFVVSFLISSFYFCIPITLEKQSPLHIYWSTSYP